jgi:hypothetical protein
MPDALDTGNWQEAMLRIKALAAATGTLSLEGTDHPDGPWDPCSGAWPPDRGARRS